MRGTCKNRSIFIILYCIWVHLFESLLTLQDKVEKERGPQADKDKDKVVEGDSDSVARRKQQQRAAHKVTLHELEGFSLVMLCSCQGIVRKLAVHLLKEIRNLFSILNIPKVSASIDYNKFILGVSGINF